MLFVFFADAEKLIEVKKITARRKKVFIKNITTGLSKPPQYFSLNAKINKQGYESLDDVMQNVKGWIEQIKPLMDFDAKDNPPRIVYNNEWLSKFENELTQKSFF